MLTVGNEPEIWWHLVASTPVNWFKSHQRGCINFTFPYKRDATGYKKQWPTTSIKLSGRDLLQVLNAAYVVI
jgi:hypothetical protein